MPTRYICQGSLTVLVRRPQTRYIRPGEAASDGECACLAERIVMRRDEREEDEEAEAMQPQDDRRHRHHASALLARKHRSESSRRAHRRPLKTRRLPTARAQLAHRPTI